MPELLVRIKKKSDGSAALSCLRADGTTTWQRQDGKLGMFFPPHDITHYAVETVLGMRRAFYGLVAEGWDLSSFEAPGLQTRLPEEARRTELIVGYFDLERMTGVVASAEEFNEKIQGYYAEHKLAPPSFRLVDRQLARIRALRDELLARWRAVPAGEVLELPFDRDALIPV